MELEFEVFRIHYKFKCELKDVLKPFTTPFIWGANLKILVLLQSWKHIQIQEKGPDVPKSNLKK